MGRPRRPRADGPHSGVSHSPLPGRLARGRVACSLTGMWAVSSGPVMSVNVAVERTCGCGGVTDRRDAGAVGPRSSGYVGPACQSPFLHSTGRAIVLCSVQCSISSVQRNLAVWMLLWINSENYIRCLILPVHGNWNNVKFIPRTTMSDWWGVVSSFWC
jgi:hypothetical protein